MVRVRVKKLGLAWINHHSRFAFAHYTLIRFITFVEIHLLFVYCNSKEYHFPIFKHLFFIQELRRGQAYECRQGWTLRVN